MASVVLNLKKQDNITRRRVNILDAKILNEPSYFIAHKYKKSLPKSSSCLKVAELKKSIYYRFQVRNTQELRKSGAFRMATDGMGYLDFSLKSTWQMLYRKYIDILPCEENQEGCTCINGIDIFLYFKPWQIFGLNPQTATKEDIKAAYHRLSKIYHPDNKATGNREIFERIESMYQSIIVIFT
jgi:hypothetical protein